MEFTCQLCSSQNNFNFIHTGNKSKCKAKFRKWVKRKFKVQEMSQKEVQSLGIESKGSSTFKNWAKREVQSSGIEPKGSSKFRNWTKWKFKVI